MTEETKLLSVVIPAFNQPAYTRRTLESVILQTYRPIEIVISDDNSPDSLKHMVDAKIAEGHAGITIKYYRQETNLNYYWNLQFVLGEATGHFIVLLDHDDWLIDPAFLADATDRIAARSNCFVSIANTLIENTPHTILSFQYPNWHYIDGPAFIKNYLFSTVHPSRSAVVLRFDKLKELGYKKFFIGKEAAARMQVMPDEAFVLICLLASVGSVVVTGRVVSVRGVPLESLSTTSSWRKSGGQKMFIQHFLLYQYFRAMGCRDGMQAMIHNLLVRYPCQSVNVGMIRFLGFSRSAILFMVIGVLWSNVRRIVVSPTRLPVIVKSFMVRIAKRLFMAR